MQYPIKKVSIVVEIYLVEKGMAVLLHTVSVLLQPRGSFFHYGFLDGVQFKFGPQKVHFYQNLFNFTILEHTKIAQTHYSA